MSIQIVGRTAGITRKDDGKKGREGKERANRRRYFECYKSTVKANSSSRKCEHSNKTNSEHSI